MLRSSRVLCLALASIVVAFGIGMGECLEDREPGFTIHVSNDTGGPVRYQLDYVGFDMRSLLRDHSRTGSTDGGAWSVPAAVVSPAARATPAEGWESSSGFAWWSPVETFGPRPGEWISLEGRDAELSITLQDGGVQEQRIPFVIHAGGELRLSIDRDGRAQLRP